MHLHLSISIIYIILYVVTKDFNYSIKININTILFESLNIYGFRLVVFQLYFNTNSKTGLDFLGKLLDKLFILSSILYIDYLRYSVVVCIM